MMALLWPTAKIAPIAFAFTFAIALGLAVLLGRSSWSFGQRGGSTSCRAWSSGFRASSSGLPSVPCRPGSWPGRCSIPSFIRARRSMACRRSSTGSTGRSRRLFRGNRRALDAIAQISAFVKLKLMNCDRWCALSRACSPGGDHNRGDLLFARIHCCLQWRRRSRYAPPSPCRAWPLRRNPLGESFPERR
jgi:hypothetical protein